MNYKQRVAELEKRRTVAHLHPGIAEFDAAIKAFFFPCSRTLRENCLQADKTDDEAIPCLQDCPTFEAARLTRQSCSIGMRYFPESYIRESVQMSLESYIDTKLQYRID